MRAEQNPFVRLFAAANFRDHVFLFGRATDAHRVLFSVHVHARIAKCRDAPGHCSRRLSAAARASAKVICQAAEIFRERRLTLRIGNNCSAVVCSQRDSPVAEQAGALLCAAARIPASGSGCEEDSCAAAGIALTRNRAANKAGQESANRI